jgi:RNase adaptor protein for sRNA GlmZ degradation
MGNSFITDQVPELTKCLEQICGLNEWARMPEEERNCLRIRISSFSYKNGPPRDLTGNGGGFVFDCRALPNPGRLEEYRQLTGKDPEVIAYLEGKKEVDQFLEGVFTIISQSATSYLSMGFRDLMVSFGCTGGQHRSVYCAERLNDYLQGREGVETLLEHRELG